MPSTTGRRKPKTGLFVGIGAAVLAVVVLVAGGLFLLANSGPEYEIRGAKSAAGLDRQDGPPGDSPVYTSIAGAVDRGDANTSATVTAVYGDSDDRTLFFGSTADVGDPESYLTDAEPVTTIHSSPIEAYGDHVMQVCGSYTRAGVDQNYCAWATEDTFGFVAPEAEMKQGDYAELKTRTIQMRSDLQAIVEE